MKTQRSRDSFPLPKTVIIKGVEYTVVQKKKVLDDDGKVCQGLHDHIQKVIYVEQGLPVSSKRQTFLHEMYHAYLFECNIREGLSEELEEVIVETMAQATDEQFVIKWRK